MIVLRYYFEEGEKREGTFLLKNIESDVDFFDFRQEMFYIKIEGYYYDEAIFQSDSKLNDSFSFKVENKPLLTKFIYDLICEYISSAGYIDYIEVEIKL